MISIRIANLAEVHQRHERFLLGQTRIIGETMQRGAEDVLEYVNDYPQFKPRTGALQKATKARVIRTANGRVLRITNPKVYANSIDGGARPHAIRPRNAPYLQFRTKDGRWVRTKLVRHPGNRPYKTFYRATTAAHRTMGQTLHRRLSENARRF